MQFENDGTNDQGYTYKVTIRTDIVVSPEDMAKVLEHLESTNEVLKKYARKEEE